MSGEKKLGLTFLGILVVAFCGVLTMRLMGGRSTDDHVEVNVGGPLAEVPAASPSGSTAGSASAADRTPPSASVRPGGDSFAARTPAPPPAYLPPPSAMRPAAEATLPPPAGPTASLAGATNDPFSRGPAAAPAPAPAGFAPPPSTVISPSAVASSALAPSSLAPSPSSYGATPAPIAGSPSLSGTAPPAVAPHSAPPSPAAVSNDSAPPAPLPSTAGNPLRGAASLPAAELSSGASPSDGGNRAGFASTTSPSPSAEPTLPTAGAGSGAPTGRTESAVAFSPPSAFSAGRSTPSTGASGASFAAPAVESAPPGNAFRPTADRDVAAASAALPAATPDKPYVVAPDDSFWSISEKAYGNGAYYRALFQYNRDRYPNADDVRPGSVLDIPPLDALKRQFPELTTGAENSPTAERPPVSTAATAAAMLATYVVKEGDTLIAIAREQLGKATRWTEIYELNRAVLGEKLENLRPGVELRLK